MIRKIIEFFRLRQKLNKRMVVVDETMSLQKVADVYSECICKMNGWPVHVHGGYSMYFVEVSLSIQNGYVKALHDNGLCFQNGLVKPIDANRDIPIGALEFYDDKLRAQTLNDAVSALVKIMKKYEPDSRNNQNVIVEAFKKELRIKEDSHE